MKKLSNIKKLKSFIAPKMTDHTKSAPDIWVNIHGLYCYPDMNGALTTLMTSGQRYHNFLLHLLSEMIQHLSNHLLQRSKWDRRVFANDVEGLVTRLMTEFYVSLNSSYQVFEERWISETPLIVKKQMIHQDSVTSNLHNITSNTGTPSCAFNYHGET